jgi:hypothetical protein
MLLLAGALLGLVAGLLSGGSLQNLAACRPRWALLVVAALGLKELSLHGPFVTDRLGPWLLTASSVALLAWTLRNLDRLPGIWLVASAIAMNLLAIAANGGRMPVAPALAHRGPRELLEHGSYGPYFLAGPDTRLAWLGDSIQLPGPVGGLFPQAYSPGDLLSFAGLGVVLFVATRSTRRAAPTGAITTP